MKKAIVGALGFAILALVAGPDLAFAQQPPPGIKVTPLLKSDVSGDACRRNRAGSDDRTALP
jgi:hypothetical protein